jgi:dolichol-phosphate mannosyltransferase
MTLSTGPSHQPTPSDNASENSLPDVSIVIPVVNEAENLRLLLPLVSEAFSQFGIEPEVVVVDGGSQDNSQIVAGQLGARVVEQTERGFGGALLAGFAAASAPYVITMDADLSHPPEFLTDFWRQRKDADLIIASRYMAGGKADMAASRRVLSTMLNRTYALLLNVKVHDLSSGFRLYDRRVLTSLELRARDFDILEEILVKIYVSGGRVREVPFHYKVRNSGKSHAKLVRFAWAYLKTLLRMCRLRYGR